MDQCQSTFLGYIPCSPRSLLTEPALARPPHTRVPHLVVIASTEENVVGRGVPLNQPHTPAVSVELQESLSHVPLQPALRNLPDPHLQRKESGNQLDEPGEGGPQMALFLGCRGRCLLAQGSGQRLWGEGASVRDDREHPRWPQVFSSAVSSDNEHCFHFFFFFLDKI